MNRLAFFIVTLAWASSWGCSCDDGNPAPIVDDGRDAESGDDVDGAADSDGALATDGATGDAGDGALGDASNPLDVPLEEFCSGSGTAVVVAGGCAGDIAEESFEFAVCACGTIDVQSNLDLDSFNSNAGAYGGANIGNDGHLGVNNALDMDGKLTVRGSTFVGGGGFSVGSNSQVTINLYAAGDAVQSNSSTDIGRNAFVRGNVDGRFDIRGDLHVPVTATVSAATRNNLDGMLIREEIPVARPCACGEEEILDVAAITAFGRARNDNDEILLMTSVPPVTLTSTAYENGGPEVLPLPCGRYYLTRIEQGGGLTIRAEARTVLYVDGDMNIGGGLTLELAPGAEFDLFINGALTVGASVRLGDPARPSKLRIYVGGTDRIELAASAVFGGNLYAPTSTVAFNASSDVYGSLFAHSVSFGGSAAVHFDSAIRNAGASCEPGGGTDGGVIDATTVDAGETVDAGAVVCEGCAEPGNMCSACSSDLDCCPPYVCISGECQLGL